MPDTVGFVGLGIMGRPMAANLARQHTVIGFDADPRRWEGLSAVEPAASLTALAGRCRVICLSLPSHAVEAVVLGAAGLAESMSPGSLLIDLSTGLPSTSRKLTQALAARGIAFADAPVSGGQGGAEAGSLAIMVGASEETFERARPYLSCVGASVVRVGDVGAGQVAKLVNNMIVGVTFSVVAEGFALAVSNGVDPALLHRAIKDGWAGSPVLEASAPSIASREYRPGGTIDMIQKDLSYARALATESRIAVPMTSAAHEVFVAGQAAGRGAQSQPAVFELWQTGGKT